MKKKLKINLKKMFLILYIKIFINFKLIKISTEDNDV